MTKAKKSPSKRTDAISDFKSAQRMLAEGEAELASAQQKIKLARNLLTKSTDAIRLTWSSGREARQSKEVGP